MLYRTIYILFLWIFILRFTLRCNALPHSLRNASHMTHYNHSEEALKRLLRVFGIDGTIPEHREKNRPPQYMLDLYRTYSEHSFTEERLRYSRANTVRSFFNKGEIHENGHYLYELVDSIPQHEEIVDAEFHFFTNRNTLRLQHSSHVIQIQLYENSENTTSKLLQARMVKAYSSGWEVFKVTSSVKKWITDPELNFGLTVKILDSAGHEWSSRRVHRLQNYRKPILVVFSRDSKTIKSTKHRGMHDYEGSIQNIPRNENLTVYNSELVNTRSTRSASVPENGFCMRHELRVDFDKLGWSTWIISPKWYDAYVCAGACAFPLGQNQRPTNHATVQSIVHELGLTDGIGAPCCVPTELHPVSLLYFDEHANVVLKQYDDMVAAGCGCQ